MGYIYSAYRCNIETHSPLRSPWGCASEQGTTCRCDHDRRALRYRQSKQFPTMTRGPPSGMKLAAWRQPIWRADTCNNIHECLTTVQFQLMSSSSLAVQVPLLCTSGVGKRNVSHQCSGPIVTSLTSTPSLNHLSESAIFTSFPLICLFHILPSSSKVQSSRP